MTATISLITATDLNRRIAAGASPALVDVRTPVEYRAHHIAGSELAPLDELDCASLSARIGADKECVLVCKGGTRASKAAERLAAAGMSRVTVLEGGVTAWMEAGLPVNRGQAAMSLERQVRIAAGLLVVLGVVLGAWVHPAFLALAAFVGCGLVFAGLTDWCGMGLLLAKAPWNKAGSCKS